MLSTGVGTLSFVLYWVWKKKLMDPFLLPSPNVTWQAWALIIEIAPNFMKNKFIKVVKFNRENDSVQLSRTINYY